MPLKPIIGLAIPLILLSAAHGLAAGPIALDRETIFVRGGFDEAWTNRLPSPAEKDWLAVPGIASGTRSVVLMDLPMKGIPRRKMFSLKQHAPENFTFVTSFTMSEGDLEGNTLKGIYFHNIGENWAVYLNGRLLRSEIHLDDRGRIKAYRHMRQVLIPVDTRLFNAGQNILAVRIIGDPTNIDSGFHRSTPFVIDDLTSLESGKSEHASLVLIFLYLFFGVYHLFIYFKRPQEKYNFYYGAFSALLFVYLFSRTHAVYALIPGSTLLHRIEYCSLYALLPVFGAFVDLLLTGKYSRVTKLFGAFYSVLILATALPVSNPFAIDILRVWQVTALVPLLYYTFIRIGRPVYLQFRTLFAYGEGLALPRRVLKSAGRSLTGTTAGNLMIGALVMVGCAVFDILDSLFWSYNYVLATYGFFIFTMGISLILADRFIETHKKLEETNGMIRNEMELAAHIQGSLLPNVPSGLEDWEIALAYSPLFGPSGDYYDFYISGKRLKGISIFDVSGHGISSALVTMIMKPITFRAFNRMKGAGLDEIIGMVNQMISAEIPGSENIISCILLRTRGDSVEYINAGHPNLLHRVRRTGKTRIVDNGGENFRSEPLGLGLPGAPPVVIKFRAAKGDILALYTDCILESKNEAGRRYGIERLIASLDECPQATAGEVLNHVLENFYAFADKSQIRDDFTMIIARRK
jgi:serine phosphatase RsbU (regulator of sigma subunit)